VTQRRLGASVAAAQELLERVAEVLGAQSVDERVGGRVAVAEPEEDGKQERRSALPTERLRAAAAVLMMMMMMMMITMMMMQASSQDFSIPSFISGPTPRTVSLLPTERLASSDHRRSHRTANMSLR